MNLHRLVCLAAQMRSPVYDHTTGMEVEAGDVPRLRREYGLSTRNISRARYVIIPACSGSGVVDIRYIPTEENPALVIGVANSSMPHHIFKRILEKEVERLAYM
jgi:hypothetical protein